MVVKRRPAVRKWGLLDKAVAFSGIGFKARLLGSVMRGDREATGLLLRSADADGINGVEVGGQPLLSAAAASGDDWLTRELLKAGADPNATDKRGWTPLMAAAKGGFPMEVRALMTGGAQSEARAGEMRMTALSVALMYANDGAVDCAKCLVNPLPAPRAGGFQIIDQHRIIQQLRSKKRSGIWPLKRWAA